MPVYHHRWCRHHHPHHHNHNRHHHHLVLLWGITSRADQNSNHPRVSIPSRRVQWSVPVLIGGMELINGLRKIFSRSHYSLCRVCIRWEEEPCTSRCDRSDNRGGEGRSRRGSWCRSWPVKNWFGFLFVFWLNIWLGLFLVSWLVLY